jgi:hypothetical protein
MKSVQRGTRKPPESEPSKPKPAKTAYKLARIREAFVQKKGKAPRRRGFYRD